MQSLFLPYVNNKEPRSSTARARTLNQYISSDHLGFFSVGNQPGIIMYFKLLLVFSSAVTVLANLEGPFLFFGPKSLEKFKRPALKYLDQDDLMRIYGEQAAIVVFNNQDSVPLASGNFPRLRKMLEGQTTLVLPQDFLDVHPDYISNETQVCENYYVVYVK